MTTPSLPTFAEARSAWVHDLDLVAARDRWGLALMGVGWVHLLFFAGLQTMHLSGNRHNWQYVTLWGVEFGTVLLVIRWVAGPGWAGSSPLAGVIARVWGTVLILSFNLASLNSLMGLDHEWFKPVLCTIASFGFMMMAYLVSNWFFAAAVQMYFTGVIMATFLNFAYLIHGISWWASLMVIGGVLQHRRACLRLKPITIPVKTSAKPGTFVGRQLQLRVERPA